MNSRNSLCFRACRLCVLCALLYDARANIFISRERDTTLEPLHSLHSPLWLCRLSLCSLQTAVNRHGRRRPRQPTPARHVNKNTCRL